MKLFISYAHSDLEKAKNIVNILVKGGHQPRYDKDILLPGQNWQTRLKNEILSSDIFVYMLSPKALSSKWCRWEYSLAVHQGKPIVPVLIQPVDKLPTSLAKLQYADFTQGATDESVAKLVGGLTLLQTVPPHEVKTLSVPQGSPLKEKQNNLGTILAVLTAIASILTVIIMAFALLSDRFREDFFCHNFRWCVPTPTDISITLVPVSPTPLNPNITPSTLPTMQMIFTPSVDNDCYGKYAKPTPSNSLIAVVTTYVRKDNIRIWPVPSEMNVIADQILSPTLHRGESIGVFGKISIEKDQWLFIQVNNETRGFIRLENATLSTAEYQNLSNLAVPLCRS